MVCSHTEKLWNTSVALFTYVTDGAKINKLTDFVFHKVLVKHSEVNHLLAEEGRGLKLSFEVLEEIKQEVIEEEWWPMYLQAANADPQCGCQPIAQDLTVRGDVSLRGALQVRPGVPQGKVREPQHLNNRGSTALAGEYKTLNW